MSKTTEIASAFIGGAPPGELSDVVNDIKKLTIEDPSLHSKLGPAFQKYNEEQLTTTKLPGSSEPVSLPLHGFARRDSSQSRSSSANTTSCQTGAISTSSAVPAGSTTTPAK
jgi:capping protein alpha